MAIVGKGVLICLNRAGTKTLAVFESLYRVLAVREDSTVLVKFLCLHWLSITSYKNVEITFDNHVMDEALTRVTRRI